MSELLSAPPLSGFTNSTAMIINNTMDLSANQFVYSYGITIAIATLLSAVTIVCIVGNGLVMMAVLLVHKLRTPCNCLIVSLALSDLLVGLVVMPLAAVYELLGRWPFSALMCSVWVVMDVMLCTASILNLMMIAVDRYLTVTRPFTYIQKRSAKLMLLYIMIAWSVSLLISVTPLLIGWTTEYKDGICMVNQLVGYQVYATSVAFYLPLIIMLSLYGQIFYISNHLSHNISNGSPTLHKKKTSISIFGSKFSLRNTTPQSSELDLRDDCVTISFQKKATPNTLRPDCRDDRSVTGSNSDLNESKQLQHAHRHHMHKHHHAIKTLGLIMGLFTICWLPFFVLAVVRPLCQCNIPMWLTGLLTWLGYVNSCFNPAIYTWFNREFRAPIREILFCRCCSINESIRHIDYMNQYGQ